MPITRIHCSKCGAEFIDARGEVRTGDEAICPRCGTAHVFDAGIPDMDAGLAAPGSVPDPRAREE